MCAATWKGFSQQPTRQTKIIISSTRIQRISDTQCCRFVCVRLDGGARLVNEMRTFSLSSSHDQMKYAPSRVGEAGIIFFPYHTQTECPRQMTDNVGAYAVAGLGGLENGAKRNAKADQLRLVPRHNVNKETDSCEDT